MTDADEVEAITSWGARGGGWSILVHGGAGHVPQENLERHVEGCRIAARAGAAILARGGRALDAAQRAVEVLEDDPHFNAGTGASLNVEAQIELDASVMEGSTLRGGGVCALPPFRHPIAVARSVLEHGAHVLYAGKGAESFAITRGFERSTHEAMTTEIARRRWDALRAIERGEAVADASEGWAGGTVGAVVRDGFGTVASATSTGGRLNKLLGRVGDSPILGAGTYADDDAGACSNTGDGEAIMRLCLAKTAIEWMRAGVAAEEAARAAIQLLANRVRGSGGIILVDRRGRIGLARSTKTMTWAAAGAAIDDVVAGS